MNEHRQKAVAALLRVLEANKSQRKELLDRIQILDAESDQVRTTIQQLQGSFDSDLDIELDLDEMTPITPIDRHEMEQILAEQDAIDEKQYPPEWQEGLSRVDIAKAIAQDHAGYITPNTLRRVLAQPGVKRRTSQIASVSSRVLKNAQEEFVRMWPGLYRLRNYREDTKQKGVTAEADTP